MEVLNLSTHSWRIIYCCMLIAKVAGLLLSRVTWALLKLLVIFSLYSFFTCDLVALFAYAIIMPG